MEIDTRDSGERADELYAQNVRESVHISDIAIRNEGSESDLKSKLLRYYAIIRSPGSVQPTNIELYMHMAYSMSMRSKCISRNVGAIIVGERGYVLGGGWNEVAEGQIGCGDRTIRDIKNINDIPIEMHGKEEFRIFLLNKYKDDFDRHFCYREEYEQFKRTMKYDRKKSDKGKSNIEQDERSSSNVKAQQYCRALHAEENAIIQTAKIGGMGLRNTTIYTTTFPCELCAKKIYQAGISRIIYSEPYPEALSEDVFLNDGIRKIEIEPFEGVKSHSYYRLFRPSINRKDYQKILAKM